MDVPFTVQLIVVKKKPCVQENWTLLDVKSQIIVIIAVSNQIHILHLTEVVLLNVLHIPLFLQTFVLSTVTGKRK